MCLILFTLPSFLSFPCASLNCPFMYLSFIISSSSSSRFPVFYALGCIVATFHFLCFGLVLISWTLDLISALFWNCLLVLALIPCSDLFLPWHALYFYWTTECHDSASIAESASVLFIPMFKYTNGTYFVLIYHYLIRTSFFSNWSKRKKEVYV